MERDSLNQNDLLLTFMALEKLHRFSKEVRESQNDIVVSLAFDGRALNIYDDLIPDSFNTEFPCAGFHPDPDRHAVLEHFGLHGSIINRPKLPLQPEFDDAILFAWRGHFVPETSASIALKQDLASRCSFCCTPIPGIR